MYVKPRIVSIILFLRNLTPLLWMSIGFLKVRHSAIWQENTSMSSSVSASTSLIFPSTSSSSKLVLLITPAQSSKLRTYSEISPKQESLKSIKSLLLSKSTLGLQYNSAVNVIGLMWTSTACFLSSLLNRTGAKTAFF